MRDGKKICMKTIVKTIILSIALGFFSGLICANMYNPTPVIRGGEEYVLSIASDTVISQPLPAEKYTQMHIGLLANSSIFDEDEALVFTLSQEDYSEDIEIKLCELNDERWVDVELPFHFSHLKEEDSILAVYGKKLKNSSVGVLITSGEQKIPLSNVIVNGEIVPGKYLTISYGFFSLNVFFGFFILWTFLFIILSVAWRFLQALNRKHLVLVVAVLYVLFFYVCEKRWEIQHDAWINTPWGLNYDYGVIAKALPGAFLSLFVDYISENLVWVVFHVIFIALFVSYLVLFSKWKSSLEVEKEKELVDYIFILFMVSPFFITFYFRQWGRLDIIISIFYICNIMLLIKTNEKRRIWPAYLIVLLSTSSVLTHQIFVFTLYPGVFVLFLYLIIYKKCREYIVPFILNCVIPAIAAGYVQFRERLQVPISSFMKFVEDRTNIDIFDTMIINEYYMTSKESAYEYGLVEVTMRADGIRLLISVLLLSPFIYLWIRFWKESIKRIKKCKGKIVTMLFPISILSSVPMFLTTCDYGRIAMLVVCEQIVIIVALAMIDKQIFFTSIVKQYHDGKERFGNLIWVVLAVYAGCLGQLHVSDMFMNGVVDLLTDGIQRLESLF